MNTAWFARSYPLREMRAGMAPVAWQGWVVLAGFLAVLVAAAGAGAWLASVGGTLKGAALFGFLAAAACLALMRIVNKTGDHIRSVAEYRHDQAAAAVRQGEGA